MTTTTSTSTVRARRDSGHAKPGYVLQTYRRAPLAFVRGKGRALSTTRRAASTSTCCRASASRRSATRTRACAQAVADQAQTLLHTSNLFFHPLQGQVGERLASAVGPVARSSSATAARKPSKPCLKFARRYWYTQRRTARRNHRARGIVSRPDDGRAVGHVATSTTARRSSRCCRACVSCP